MPAPRDATACLALADGTLFYGKGFGATGETVAELVFNTAMTGYQEIMTDPSYAGQVVTFTFPHIGNTGVTAEDDETGTPAAAGMVVKWDPTEPSNWRATGELTEWLTRKSAGSASAASTQGGSPARSASRARRMWRLAHDPEGKFDIEKLVAKARAWKGLVGLDLAKDVTCAQSPTAGTKSVGPGPKATPGGPARASASSRSTTAPSATSCAAWLPSAAKSPCSRPMRRPRTSSP